MKSLNSVRNTERIIKEEPPDCVECLTIEPEICVKTEWVNEEDEEFVQSKLVSEVVVKQEILDEQEVIKL